MSALARAFNVGSGGSGDRAAGRRDSVRKRSSDADATRDALRRELEAARVELRAADGADPVRVAERIAEVSAELAKASEIADALREAADSADEAAREAAAREEREALEGELRAAEETGRKAVRDSAKALGTLAEGLSVAVSCDAAAVAIRRRLGIETLDFAASAELSDVLRRLHASLVAKHADAHGRGVGSHAIEVPIFNAEVSAPTARRLGIV